MNLSKLTFASLLILSTFAACTSSGTTFHPDQTVVPETASYTPFPGKAAISQDSKGYFLTAITKVTFKRWADGSTRYDPVQEPLTIATVADRRCPDVSADVSDFVSFRKQAEIYLKPGPAARAKSVKAFLNKKPLEIKKKGDCSALSSGEDLVLRPYLSDGDSISAKIGAKQNIGFTIPKDFVPYLLVRYESGAMIPAPARADTVMIDPDGMRLFVTYRTTIRLNEKIRKIEFRAIQPDDKLKATETESRESSVARSRASRDFLRACQLPSEPGETCVSPSATVPPAVFLTSK